MKKTIAIILIVMFLLMANNTIIYAISESVNNNNEDSQMQKENKTEEPSEDNKEDNITNATDVEENSAVEPIFTENIDTKKQIMTASNSEEGITDGIYRISIANIDYTHMAVEIKDGSKQVEANAQIGNWSNINNDKNKFKITYVGDGYYSIGLANTNNMLDVQNGGMEAGTNVWQHADNKTDAQRWKIVKNSDGSYSFISKKNNLYLTVANGNMSEGTNLEVNNKTNKVGQNFKLINLDNKPTKVLENGVYKINLNSNSNLALEIENSSTVNGGNLRVGKWIDNTSNIQRRFELTYEDDGYYTIKSVNSGKVLEIEGGGMTIETNVWQYDGNYTDSQRWEIVKNADKSYSIINKKSGLYLDIQNGSLTQNTNLQVNSKIEGNRQKFAITKITEEEQIVPNGTYRISLKEPEYSHMSIEIKDGSKQVEANAQIGEWSNKNNDKNKFKITYVGNGYYSIGLANTNNMLDVQNGGMEAGTNVWQHKDNQTDAQRWKIIKNDDGNCSFISKKNNLYLTAKDVTTSQGGNLEVNNKSNKVGQSFKLINLNDKPSRTLEDGIYKISTTANSQRTIGITGTLSDNGAIAQIKDWTEVANGDKKFDIKYNEDDGYYTIKSVYSGKVLEVQSGGMKNNTLIWQYDENYTDSQRWKITRNSNGTYTLQNKKSDLYLSIENTDVKVGRNVVLYEKSSSKAQNFNITTVDKTEGAKIEEGTYKIVCASNESISIDIENASREAEANVQLGNTSSTIRNEFNIVPDGNGYYVIKSVNSGNVLDAKNGGTEAGTNLWQHIENGTDAQKWIIEQNTDGTYSIVCKKSGLYLDVYDGKVASGTNIWLFTGNGTPAQKFKLIKQSKKTEKYVEEGLYKFETKQIRSIVMDIESASKQDGGIVQIWNYTGEKQQQFVLYYENNGYYYIENMNSNKVIGTDGTNVKQYTKDLNKENQKWILKKQSDEAYHIISKETGLAITVPNWDVRNGTDLKMETLTGSDFQSFIMEKAGVLIDENRYPGIKDQIDKLTIAHPNWNFEILYTGLDFDTVVNNEYDVPKHRNLVSYSSYKGDWIAPNAYSSGGWYSASRNAVAYFMDTRNFLNEIDVFQFLDVNSFNYDSVRSSEISKQINGTFLEYYPGDLTNACLEQDVNPYFVIARLFQEQGRKGTTIGTGMDGGDGKTYYNPFNINALLGREKETALAKAKEKGWDTMKKALVGGIDFLKQNWLENYQNTLYQNKFDIDLRSGSSLYTHQYMQNLSAAYSEARTLRNCYTSSGKLDSSFTFIIPVYENMPSSISAKPSGSSTSSGSSGTYSSSDGPMDAKVVVDSILHLRESASTSSKSLRDLSNGTHLLSVKRAINGDWNQVVTDDGEIGYVSGDYLQFINDVTTCNIKKVTNTRANARIGPSTSSDWVLYTLNEGTTVTVIDSERYYIDGYTWDRVILPDNTQAFIASKYLS